MVLVCETCVISIAAFIMLAISQVQSRSYDDSRDLHLYLLKNYSKILNPSKNQSDQLVVTVDMYLNSIIDFNPVSGIMTFSAAYFLYWNDEIIGSRWQQSEFNEINETQIGIHNVWVPKLYIQNSANYASIFKFSSEIDSETSFVKYKRNGNAVFRTGTVLQTTCLTDVRYYPLDEHACDVKIIPVDITNTVINTTTTDVITPVTYPNSEWKLRSTVDVDIVVGLYKEINFKIVLSRKPIFITTNLVFPVMIITVVNGLSFFVPIESGERLSFGTSLPLMLIVFLTTVLDMLPPTNNSLSLFNIFICIELIYSCMITLGIVMTLYFHQRNNDTKVSRR